MRATHWPQKSATRPGVAGDAPQIQFKQQSGRVEITVGKQRFATYVYRDKTILRPYFCNVLAPDGTQVTRPHPPYPG